MARRDNGSAAVELVMIAPALLLLLAVTVAAGRLLSVKSGLESVAREAARIGSGASDAASAAEAADKRAGEAARGLGFDEKRLRTTVQPGQFERGAPFLVAVEYQVRLSDLPAFGVLPGGMQVSARHVELVERHKSR